MVRLMLLTLLALTALAEPAIAKKSDEAPEGTVSQIRDARIKESSGLALSVKHDDLVYTVNDRGNDPTIYAVTVSTGHVVGATDLGDLDVEDTESIAVDSEGTLWLGDLGDNDHQRDNISIISFPEPGPGDHTVGTVNRYGVELPDGPFDVEGMLVHPDDGQVFLVSKNREGLGTIYRLPTLTPDATVKAEDLDVEAPQMVTDAAFTHDGTRALLRTEKAVWVYDPVNWEPVAEVKAPKLQQGESITVERGNQTMLLGSEGKDSPLVRVPLPSPDAESETINVDGQASGFGHWVDLGVLALAGLLTVLVLKARRRVRAGS